MESYLYAGHFDLVTPDGSIRSIRHLSPKSAEVELHIHNISPLFVGYDLDLDCLSFNLKSTLAQLGLHAIGTDYRLFPGRRTIECHLQLQSFGPIASQLLGQLKEGSFIGKLFAKDPRRCVRQPDYLLRMFGRVDPEGRPLLSLGGPEGRDELLLEKIDGRTVAFLELKKGVLSYDQEAILGLFPTMIKALQDPQFHLRTLIRFDQIWTPLNPRIVQEDQILLVRTAPLHIRTSFGKVVDSLLPPGYFHTSANVLEPDTMASGDVYEFFGSSQTEITQVPIEFYTLEPHREHVFFSDRDQLQNALEDPQVLFQAFQTSPEPLSYQAATFVVKGEQLHNLQSYEWISRKTHKHEFPGVLHQSQQAALAHQYIKQQPSYPFLKAMESRLITSQGILLSRYLPSPLIKSLLLSECTQRCLKAIYFQYPSLAFGSFFSHEDRSMLLDLSKFGIPVFWVDASTQKILQYTPKPGKDSGMFVPQDLVDVFIHATVFGIYGSNLLAGDLEDELSALMLGIEKMKAHCDHPLLNPNSSLALVTGGGPGVMEMGNRVAKNLHILSCANIVDFHNSYNVNISEQKQNLYIDAKMTYRLDQLVERQAEFHLDFPIILMGGIGTDFEYCLEELRRKAGSRAPTPVLLFGKTKYWQQKITPRFQTNMQSGTISQSEWISNCFFCIQNAEEGLAIYKRYFAGTLPIGPKFPKAPLGFVPSNIF